MDEFGSGRLRLFRRLAARQFRHIEAGGQAGDQSGGTEARTNGDARIRLGDGPEFAVRW